MRIGLTGTSGFIGSHLLQQLTHYDQIDSVIVYSRKDKQPFRQDNQIVIPCSIELNSSHPLFKFIDSDVFIHLAWEKVHDFHDPNHIHLNLPAHFDFLSNLIQQGLKSLTIVGSCFEYGLQEGELDESLHPKPITCYAMAKHKLYERIQEVARKYECSLKWIRLFYLWGPGQHKRSFVPSLEDAISNGHKSFNMSPGDQQRDYLHIDDVVKYIIPISLQKDIDGVINCCSGSPITLRCIAEKIIKNCNSTIRLNCGYYDYAKHEPQHFWGNTNKMNRALSAYRSSLK